MGNARSLVMIVISLIMGLAAVLLAARWMTAQGQATKVAVAAVEIDLGSKLNGQMLQMVDWPSGSMPKGAFLDAKQLEGRVVKTSLQKGEPVLESKLAPVGTSGGLSAVVAQGKRAITVRVNDVVGVAGFALPGNYVDILVSTEDDRSKEQDKERQISKIVLEHILVLAVAQEANRDETKPKVVNAVTLEVTPQEAELLDLARSVGSLSLVLRNQIDPDPAKTAGATKEVLFGRVQSPPVVAEATAPVRVVVKRSRAKAKTRVAASAVPATVTPAAEPRSTDRVEVIRGMDRFTQQFEKQTETEQRGAQQ